MLDVVLVVVVAARPSWARARTAATRINTILLINISIKECNDLRFPVEVVEDR